MTLKNPLRDASIEPIGIRITLIETAGEQSAVVGEEPLGRDERSICAAVDPRSDDVISAFTNSAAETAPLPVPLVPVIAVTSNLSAADAAGEGSGVGDTFVDTIFKIDVPAERASFITLSVP